MHQESYPLIRSPKDELTFFFLDEGKTGEFLMAVVYSRTDWEGIYNLAFGPVIGEDEEGNIDIDDKINTNNGTSSLVIATVVKTLNTFWEKYPAKSVFFRGSDDKRTLAYRRIIDHHSHEIGDRVNFFSITKNNQIVPFSPKIEAKGYILEPKT